MSVVSEDWEDYKPPVRPTIPTNNQWEGEDEEDDVKDNWDDDDEEKPQVETQPKPTKTKKKLADIIAEKEAKRAEDLERKRKEREEFKKSMSPSEQLAEKIRIQKIKEDSDLQIATELLGVSPDCEDISLDSIDLTTSKSLEQFRQTLVKKIRETDRLEKRTFYVTFIEDLVKDLCLNLEMDDVKKVSTSINTIYNEKVKASKANKGKKKTAGKAKLNAGQGAIADQVAFDYEYNDYDDFI